MKVYSITEKELAAILRANQVDMDKGFTAEECVERFDKAHSSHQGPWLRAAKKYLSSKE